MRFLRSRRVYATVVHMPISPLFSVCCIVKNGANTLPRMFRSLNEFMGRQGQVIIVDTGSSDKSADVARSFGAEVTEVGERFMRTIDADLAQKINERFVVGDEPPIVQAGSRLFHFAEARNFAASLARNDWVAWIDSDEAFTALDIDYLNEVMADSNMEHLEYDFVFSHKPDGIAPEMAFTQAKTYRRSRVRWAGAVHEVIHRYSTEPVPAGVTNHKFVPPGRFHLEHWQEPNDHRSNYLAGLGWDAWMKLTEDPASNRDRQFHYLGRELAWMRRPLSAIKLLEEHVQMNGWPAERAESWVLMGDCWGGWFGSLNEPDKQMSCYHAAFHVEPTRRVGLLRLAGFYDHNEKWQASMCFAKAALEIPWHGGFYGDSRQEYEDLPHYYIYRAAGWLGRIGEAQEHLKKVLEYCPWHSAAIRDAVFYFGYDLTKAAANGRTPLELLKMYEGVKAKRDPDPLLQKLTVAVRNGSPASFVKLGDGEQFCMDGAVGANCDGHPYSAELGNKLKESFESFKKRYDVRVVGFADQVPYNCLLHRVGSSLASVKDFWMAVRHSDKPKVFIGPARLRPAAAMLRAQHVEIPLVNAFSEYAQIKERLLCLRAPGTIFIFCAGMPAKVWIADLLDGHYDISCIDAGSAFDPMFVGQTRTEQLPMDLLQREYGVIPSGEYMDEGIDGWMSVDELGWLYETAKKCKNVLEIGSWRGRSTHALLSGCKGTVTAVDTWQGSSDPGDFTYSLAKKSDVFAEFQKNVGHFPNLEVLRMSSAEAAKVCESRKFDMVFIDATHTYEGVCDDIKAWKDNAALILAGHDFTQTWIGVQRAVRDSIGEPDEVVDTIWVHRAKDSKGRLFTIWLGDPPPPAIQKCIDSQKIPGYGHKVLGLEECPKGIPYLDAAIAAKKWIKAADFLRMHELYERGGIYLDADVEVLPGKNFDDLLEYSLFSGREENGFVSTAIMGARPRHPLIKEHMQEVASKFRGDDDKPFESSIELWTPRMYIAASRDASVRICEPEFFFPYNHQTGVINVTPQTIVFHHFYKSWVPDGKKDLLPMVSILLPTLGRPEGLQRCLESIDRLYYPKHLIEVLIDDNPVASVPIKVNRLMRQATGEVFVYAANDMEFTPESLYRAVKSSSGHGLVAFNTGELLPDKGNINEHFLIWRTTVEKIGGVIFNERFHHAGCDNLLWALCERIGEASRCEEAVVRHYHFSRGAVMDEVYRRGWNQVEKDRAVLKEELAKLEAM